MIGTYKAKNGDTIVVRELPQANAVIIRQDGTIQLCAVRTDGTATIGSGEFDLSRKISN